MPEDLMLFNGIWETLHVDYAWMQETYEESIASMRGGGG
jgi:hypothetical protein